MALLYPWASKDYLLWEMSLAQIIMYHNIGIEQKYGKQDSTPKKAVDMSYEELAAKREELRAQFGDIGNG